MEDQTQTSSGGDGSVSVTDQGKNNKYWVYVVVLLLVGLGLVVAIGYWYASKQTVSVTFEEETPTTAERVQPTNGPVTATYTMEELDKVKDSQWVVRGENISMAGTIQSVDGNEVDIERGGELIKLMLEPETKILFIDVDELDAVEVGDYGRVIDSARGYGQEREGKVGDILLGSKAQVFFGRKESSDIYVVNMWVYQEG